MWFCMFLHDFASNVKFCTILYDFYNYSVKDKTYHTTRIYEIFMKKEIENSKSIFLTSTQTSRLINISVGTLKKYVREGKIKTLKTPGGHYRFNKNEILKKLYK